MKISLRARAKQTQLCILVMCLCMVMIARSQEPTTGIKWTIGLSWEQVKQKAKAENKYIFLDCYTTWCKPCKQMDKEVYTNDSVAEALNNQYIPVKVQMDKTEKDDDFTKSWYNAAETIEKEFYITGYPSLIFLNPEGKIVSKDLGYRAVEQVISLAKAASTKTYLYAEYDKLAYGYSKGIKNYERMPYMIKTAFELGEKDLSKQFLDEYSNYMAGLPRAKRYNKENIELLEWWSQQTPLNSSKDRFKFFYKDGDIIDKIMDAKGYAAKVVDRTIQAEVVDSFYRMQEGETITITGVKMKNSDIMFVGLPIRADGKIAPDYGEADWKDLEKMIRKEFNGECATRNVLNAKIQWYQKHMNYAAYSKASLAKFKKYRPNLKTDDFNDVNIFVMNTFLYVSDKALINEVIESAGNILIKDAAYLESVKFGGPDWIWDSYANLLYKAGRVQEAIQWEEKALDHAIKFKDPFSPIDIYQKTIDAMKKGEKTPTDGGAM